MPLFRLSSASRPKGLIRRRDAWRHDGFEMLGPILVDAREISVRDTAQALAQLIRYADRVEPGVLMHDRLDGVDMVHDQVGRHPREIGCVFDNPAEALGDGT